MVILSRLDAALKDMMVLVTAEDKEALRRMGMGALLILCNLNPELEFMDACLDKWDPLYHVFRFLLGDICPFPEEFAAICGWRHDADPVVMPYTLGSRRRFADFLQLSRQEADRLFIDGKVRLIALVERMSNPKNDLISRAARRTTILYVLL